MVKLVTEPSSASSCWEISKRVVSTGYVLVITPVAVCNLSRDSVWTFGAPDEAAGAATGAAAGAGGARPSRRALAASAFRRRSSLS
uniref:Candidate secreted effector n=1 Tax=Meloidogyne incognita TaxID=6306 RepID=A0A914N782_MELIC